MASKEYGVACDPKRVGQVDIAAQDLAGTAERILVLAQQLEAQLDPVLSAPPPNDGAVCDSASFSALYARRLQDTDSLLRAAEGTLRGLLVRLEI